MMTTPGNASPDEHDEARDGAHDGDAPATDPATKGGAEIGVVEGEGSTFEPEEDPDGQP